MHRISFTPLFLVILAGLVSAAAPAQVPASVVRIINLDTSRAMPVLEYQVTGNKAVAAVVVRDIAPGPNQGFVVWQIHHAMTTNQTGSLQVWPDVDAPHFEDQVQIAAVIFTDRTHLGSAPDRAADGEDAVSEIFDYWRGKADVSIWKKAIERLPQDDHGFVQAFLAKAAATQVPEAVYSRYAAGVLEVDAGMKATARRLQRDLANGQHASAGPADPANTVRDEITAHQFLVKWVNDRAGLSQIDATDAGQAVRQ